MRGGAAAAAAATATEHERRIGHKRTGSHVEESEGVYCQPELILVDNVGGVGARAGSGTRTTGVAATMECGTSGCWTLQVSLPVHFRFLILILRMHIPSA